MYHIYANGLDVCQTRDEEIAYSVENLLNARESVFSTLIRWEDE